jgi:hypothetical protein
LSSGYTAGGTSSTPLCLPLNLPSNPLIYHRGINIELYAETDFHILHMYIIKSKMRMHTDPDLPQQTKVTTSNSG